MTNKSKKPSPPKGTKQPVRQAPWAASVAVTLLAIVTLIFAPMLAGAHDLLQHSTSAASWLVPGLIVVGAGIKLGVLYTTPEGMQLSGKSGSIVWLKNYVRRIKGNTPTVRTVFTTYVRATFASFSSLWNSLTQPQQNGWNNGKGHAIINRLGKSIELAGKALYVRLNCNLTNIGVSPITNFPAPVGVPAPQLTSTPAADLSATTLDVIFDNGSTSYGYLIEATSIMSFGTNRPGRNRFRVIDSKDTSNTSPLNTTLWTKYVTRFAVPAAGDVFFIRVRYISNVSGNESIPSEVFKVVVAA